MIELSENRRPHKIYSLYLWQIQAINFVRTPYSQEKFYGNAASKLNYQSLNRALPSRKCSIIRHLLNEETLLMS